MLKYLQPTGIGTAIWQLTLPLAIALGMHSGAEWYWWATSLFLWIVVLSIPFLIYMEFFTNSTICSTSLSIARGVVPAGFTPIYENDIYLFIPNSDFCFSIYRKNKTTPPTSVRLNKEIINSIIVVN